MPEGVNGLVEGKGMVVMTVPFWYDVASLSVECTAVVCRFVCIVCIIYWQNTPFRGKIWSGKWKITP